MLKYSDFTSACEAHNLEPVSTERIIAGGSDFIIFDADSREKWLSSATLLSPMFCDVDDTNWVSLCWLDFKERELARLLNFTDKHEVYESLSYGHRPVNLEAADLAVRERSSSLYGLAHITGGYPRITTKGGYVTNGSCRENLLFWRLGSGADLSVQTKYQGNVFARSFGHEECYD